ncbi:DUF1343 domain-containing protein [Longimicrobium sp.]|uniref:exo-beta-N-acetylmuramidase NamZ family protein n=1 Tax=Longimicrobium sp. TaxID=2029185 RepID=UPI002C03F27C|nr:DUF1343 domain-containing protein [Longimicrobium sp.]HSU13975.1 DUF1343 domain-containing protein [Longimicrobium sp.]
MSISLPVRIAAAGALTAAVAATAVSLSYGQRTPSPAATIAHIAPVRATPPAPREAQAVTPGLEVLLRDSLHLVRGKRVGLITNHTAVTPDGRSAIDLLHQHPQVRLVALFGPEHGIRGNVDGGAHIASQRDARTGLTIHSLYGATQRPTPAMLRGIDVLLFDMQDIGARAYTYVWTMTMAMEEAAKAGIPFIVLDRPNPVTARVEGPLMQFEMRNRGPLITGHFPVPLRHGLTAGELARYVNGEYRLGTRLTVVPADGWRGGDWFDETGLRWINPSPNIRTLDAALSFSGLVMLETTNLNVGRGTEAPFSYVGAPYVDGDALLRRVRAYGLPGVRFERAEWTPRGSGWMQFAGRRCHGVRLAITDREAYQPVLTALVFLVELRKMYPEQLGMGSMRQMLGSEWAPAAVRAGEDPRSIFARWQQEDAQWERSIAPYRLYPAE